MSSPHDKASEKEPDLFSVAATERSGERKITNEVEVTEDFPNAYAEASQACRSVEPLSPKHEQGVSDGATLGATNAICISISHEAASFHSCNEKTKCRTKRKFSLESAKEPRAELLPRMMTVRDVAAYMGISVSKVWRLTKKNNGFPRPVRIGNSTRWDRRDIDQYLEDLRCTRSGGD